MKNHLTSDINSARQFRSGDKVTETFDGCIIEDAEILIIKALGKVRLRNSSGEEWDSHIVWLKLRK